MANQPSSDCSDTSEDSLACFKTESWENYPTDFLIKSDNFGLDEDYCDWMDCKLCKVVKCMIKDNPNYTVSTRFCSLTHLVYILAHRDIHYVGITTIPLRLCLRQVREAIDSGESSEEKLIHYYRYRDISSAEILVVDHAPNLEGLKTKANQYMKQWGAVEYGLNMSYMSSEREPPFCEVSTIAATHRHKNRHRIWIPSSRDKGPSVEVPLPATLGDSILPKTLAAKEETDSTVGFKV